MKSFMKKIVSTALVATLALGSMLTLGSCKSNKSDTIKIGVSGPLTGGAAKYGIAVKNSAQLAIDEINENGGLDGMKFELIAMDDKHDPDNVSMNYATMFENGMHMSLGCVTTKPGLEFKELAKADNVFVLTPSATGDDIVTDSDNAFQMCFSDNNQGTASAQQFKKTYPAGTKIGVFYRTDDEYSAGIYDKFVKEIGNHFGTVTVATFTGEALDFSSQAKTLEDCDVIFLPIYTKPAAAFMLDCQETNLKADATFYGCDGLDGVETEFDITKVSQKVSYLSHFNSNSTEAPASEFIQKYNDKYEEEKEPLNQFGASAYDCVYAIYYALKFAKDNGVEFDTGTSASEFCDILTDVFNDPDFVFRGVTGEPDADGKGSKITWSSDGYVNKSAIEYVIKEAD